MSRHVLDAVGHANVAASVLSLDVEHCSPWALFTSAGWLATAANEAR